MMQINAHIFGVVLLSISTLAPNFSVAQSCICLRCAFGSYKSYVAHAESMSPALRPGDCFVARQIFDDPDQVVVGDIVTFSHPKTGKEFVKRVMAKGGDSIQLIDGKVWLNGDLVQNEALENDSVPFEMTKFGSLPRCNTPVKKGDTCERSQFHETLQNGTRYKVLSILDSVLDNTQLFNVPEGFIFVMGDHRDNSTDSRMPLAVGGIGFVPLENLIGIVELDPK